MSEKSGIPSNSKAIGYFLGGLAAIVILLILFIPGAWFQGWQSKLDFIQKVVIVAGIPLSIASYIYTKKKDREQAEKDRYYQELQTYMNCKDLWLDYLRECLRHPETMYNPFEDADTGRDLSITDKIMINMIITMFERSYLLFADKSEAFRKAQWEGWDFYIRLTTSRQTFLKEWQEIGIGYDACFQTYMEETIKTNLRANNVSKLEYETNPLYRACPCPRHNNIRAYVTKSAQATL